MRLLAVTTGLSLALTACAPVGTPGAGSTVVERPKLTLARSGFILPGSGTDGLVSFGTPQLETVRAASRAFGPPVDTATNEECGAGPMEFVNYATLSLHFMHDEFVGWSTSDAMAPVTADGIGIGATERALTSAYNTTIVVDSLGREFDAEGFYGLIEAGQISTIWAGTSCVFR